MASTALKQTKDGRRYYEIRVRMGRDGTTLSSRWYVPEGWSATSIERELRKQAAEFERRCKAGEVTSRASKKAQQEAAALEAAKIQTLRQYAELVFMPAKRITISENTRDSFQRALEVHILPTLGDKKLPEITPADITALLLKKQDEGQSHGSVIKLYTVLNLIFKMAYLGDSIDRNPMDKVQRPRPRKDEKGGTAVEAFTPEELRYILDCLDKEPLKWRAMIRLMVDTGLRRGEACGLKWENIDFTRNAATICGNLCYTKSAGIYLDTPKTGKTREVYFSDAVAKLLHQLRKEQATTGISQFVFSQDGSSEPIHPQSPTRYLAKFGKRYGVEIHPHKLRHSFASVAITNGADIASVSEVLGHADKSTTLRMYTHANEESKRKAAGIVLAAIGE